MKETNESISDSLQRISSSYVYWYNLKYDRCGHLFQGRFKSETFENTASFKKVLRYIHQNPLKASLAKDIYENKWTSIHEYFKPNTFIDTQIPLLLFSQNYTIPSLISKNICRSIMMMSALRSTLSPGEPIQMFFCFLLTQVSQTPANCSN
jgi:hypothetical protein